MTNRCAWIHNPNCGSTWVYLKRHLFRRGGLPESKSTRNKHVRCTMPYHFIKGTCWKVYTRQLKPLAAEANMLGALLLYKEFHQDGPPYTKRAGWIGHALKHGFEEQPGKNGGIKVPTSRVIAVLQGWNVTDDEINAQIQQANAAGAAGYVVALAQIDQSWQPRIHKWR